MTVTFERRTAIRAAVEVVFDLSLSIDAHLDSMHASGERAVDGVTSGPIGLGEHVTWKAKHFGVPFTMTSKIVELERPSWFVDEQVRGPFRKFRHEHRFEVEADSCIMIDRVQFDAPLGPIGWLAERLALGSYLRALIERRNDFLKAAAESDSP